MRKRKEPQLSRTQSLAAKPIATSILESTELENGNWRIVIEIEPPRFSRLVLRLPNRVKREFELDAIGMIILDLCDGQKSVHYIIDRFAKQHQLDVHEAERAVTRFLQTMIRKGLVSVAITRGAR